MEALTLVYRWMFTQRFWSKYGDAVKYQLRYKCTFRRYDDSEYTYVTVETEHRPTVRLKCKDAGLSWKSLFYAYRWCLRDSAGHLTDWTELDGRYMQFPEISDCDSGNQVIPELKLSTGDNRC